VSGRELHTHISTKQLAREQSRNHKSQFIVKLGLEISIIALITFFFVFLFSFLDHYDMINISKSLRNKQDSQTTGRGGNRNIVVIYYREREGK